MPACKRHTARECRRRQPPLAPPSWSSRQLTHLPLPLLRSSDDEYTARVRANFAALRAALDALDASSSGAPPPPPGWQERFRGSPGVRMEDEAIGWAELCAIVGDGSTRALGTLGRTPLQVRARSWLLLRAGARCSGPPCGRSLNRAVHLTRAGCCVDPSTPLPAPDQGLLGRSGQGHPAALCLGCAPLCPCSRLPAACPPAAVRRGPPPLAPTVLPTCPSPHPVLHSPRLSAPPHL